MRQYSANPGTDPHSTRGLIAPATRQADTGYAMARVRRWLGLTCAALAGVFGLSGQALANDRPNIVLVQVDDMSRALLNPVLADGKPAMPNLQDLIDGEGANFTSYYNTTPLCSPSRSALLSGQFGRNSGVVGNKGEYGGWTGWQNRDILDQNLATMLQGDGYHTAHFGKFLNAYDRADIDPLEIPPGWNTWVSDATDQSSRSFYGYTQLVRVKRDGEVVEGSAEGEFQGPFGDPTYADNDRAKIDPKACTVTTESASGRECYYHTDRMTRLAADEIREVNEPLFLQLDYFAPHADDAAPSGPQPATRHLGLANGVRLPKGPAFNENNTSDKAFPARQNNGLLREGPRRAIATRYRTGLESMRAVDEGIGYLLETLRETGKLENTYFVFLSDNGFFYGEHRFPRSKYLAYEPSARVPLIIDGPDIAGGEVPSLVNTTDLAPTLLDAADVQADVGYEMDGKSLLPVIRGEDTNRRALLIERITSTEMRGGTLAPIEPYPLDPRRPQGETPNLPYRALRIGRHKYIKYTQGGEELYDLRRDPNELYSQARNPGYRNLRDYMRQMLGNYSGCSGAECLIEPDDVPRPGKFRLDARKPPGRFSTKVAYLYRDAVYVTVGCRTKRPCRKTLTARYGPERVSETVRVKVEPNRRQRVRLPVLEDAAVKLQRASENKAKIQVRQSTASGSSATQTRVSRPVLRQN